MHHFLRLGMLLAAPMIAQSTELRLVCTVQANQDGAFGPGVVRPKDVVTIDYRSDGSASISSTLHKRTLEGKVTEHEVVGIWRSPNSSEDIFIGRYTSEYRYRSAVIGSSPTPTILYGICQATGKPVT